MNESQRLEMVKTMTPMYKMNQGLRTLSVLPFFVATGLVHAGSRWYFLLMLTSIVASLLIYAQLDRWYGRRYGSVSYTSQKRKWFTTIITISLLVGGVLGLILVSPELLSGLNGRIELSLALFSAYLFVAFLVDRKLATLKTHYLVFGAVSLGASLTFSLILQKLEPFFADKAPIFLEGNNLYVFLLMTMFVALFVPMAIFDHLAFHKVFGVRAGEDEQPE